MKKIIVVLLLLFGLNFYSEVQAAQKYNKPLQKKGLDYYEADAPTDADYLVGTANADLSAEIVVGTTPGGELGGTWASPTVDSGIHDDEYVNVTGDTMTGALTINTNSATALLVEQDGVIDDALKVDTANGKVYMGRSTKGLLIDSSPTFLTLDLIGSGLARLDDTWSWKDSSAGAGDLVNILGLNSYCLYVGEGATGYSKGAAFYDSNRVNYVEILAGEVKLVGDNKKLILGAGNDASISYDGTNPIINPKEVGSGYLDVLGKVNADNFVSDVATGTAPYACTSTTVNTNLNADLLDGKNTGTSGNTIPLLDGANTWSAAQVINTNSTTALLVEQDGVMDNTLVVDTTNGRVGIGVASPSKKLVVGNDLGSFTSDDVVISGTASNGRTGFVAGDDVNNGFYLRWEGDTERFVLFTKEAGTWYRTIDVLTGNVGIGTTGPDAKLDVLATTEQLRLTYADGTNYSSFTQDVNGDLLITATGGDISFSNENLLTTGTLGAGAITGTSFIVGANTLDTTEWAFLDGQDQAVKVASNVSFNTLALGGATIGDDALAIDWSPVNDNLAHVAQIALTPSSTVTGTYNNYALNFAVTPAISSGVTDSGQKIGIIGQILGDSTHAGTLASMYGNLVNYGHGTGTLGTTNNAYGFWVRPYHKGGTIDNMYSLYFQSPLTGGTVTNKYDMKSVSAWNWWFASDNQKIRMGATEGDFDLFSDGTNAQIDSTGDILLNPTGNVGIGTINPQALLDIVGTFRTNSSSGALASGDGLEISYGGIPNTGAISAYDRDTSAWRDLRITASDLVLNYDSLGDVGINVAVPAAKLHVDQSSTTGTIPVLTLDQADVSEEFIRLIGTSTTDASRSLVDAADMTTPGTIKGWIKVYIQDDQVTNPIVDGVYYIPFYSAPTA